MSGSAQDRPLELWCDAFPVLSESFVAAEARELAGLGHPLSVRAVVPGEGPKAEVTVRYEERSRGNAWALLRVLARHPVACAADLAQRRRWRREEHPVPLRHLAPDILRLERDPRTRIHVHFAGPAALSAMRVSRILGRPWSLTAHAYDIFLCPMNLREKLRGAALVTSGCDYTVAELRRIVGADRAARIHRIVMGVDPACFVRTIPAAEGATVVAVGRLVEKKGFVHLIRAAADPALTGLLERMTIVGEGPLRPIFEAEISRLNLQGRVDLVGALAPEQVRSALEAAAVLAMPCVVTADGDRDSMPVVVKEALAMELPVVLSDAVGLPELARPAFARLVPPGDSQALAAALAELLALTAEERTAMGRAGRAFVSEQADVRRETARLSALLTER